MPVKEQVTSGNARSCCEAGEERFAKSPVPTIDQVKQAARGAQDLPADLTAVLARADRSEKAVQPGRRIVLLPKLDPLLQSCDLGSQEQQESPERAAVQCPLVDLLLARRRDVPEDPAAGRHGLLVGEPILLQVGPRQRQQAKARVAPVR
jgi:hypothetical protein